jgi:hypothetical protein
MKERLLYLIILLKVAICNKIATFVGYNLPHNMPLWWNERFACCMWQQSSTHYGYFNICLWFYYHNLCIVHFYERSEISTEWSDSDQYTDACKASTVLLLLCVTNAFLLGKMMMCSITVWALIFIKNLIQQRAGVPKCKHLLLDSVQPAKHCLWGGQCSLLFSWYLKWLLTSLPCPLL